MQKFNVEVYREVTRTFWQKGELVVEAESEEDVNSSFEDNFEYLTKDIDWGEEEETESSIGDSGVESIKRI